MSQPETLPSTPATLFCRRVFGNPPTDWTEVPVKQIGRLQGGAGFPHAEQGIEDEELEFHKVNALGNSHRNAFLTQSENTISYSTAQRLGAFVFPVGSIVFAKVGAALMLSRFRLLRRKACLDNNMMGLVVSGSNSSDFVRYALQLFPMAYIVNPGAVPSINERNIGEVSIPMPSSKMQKQIAAFLDYETAKIDGLIEKQQQLIALLGEKRQAVISDAVTKGLNPDAPMRDSRIEWLGEVPEHWDVKMIGQIANVVRGGSPRPAGDPLLFNGNYSPWVTVAEITKDSEIDLTATSTFLTKRGSRESRLFKDGTLLMTNSGGSLGVPKILRIDANANDGVLGFLDLQLDPHFVYFYLSTLTGYLREIVKLTGGSTQINLNTNLVKKLAIAVPPSDEIEQIVALIFKSRRQFKALQEKAHQAVELLQERRTALISAAVTGKIDVRGWKPPSSARMPETEMEVA